MLAMPNFMQMKIKFVVPAMNTVKAALEIYKQIVQLVHLVDFYKIINV